MWLQRECVGGRAREVDAVGGTSALVLALVLALAVGSASSGGGAEAEAGWSMI